MALQLAIEQGGILEHDAAESKKQGAAVWYKDEGGQHKCILLKLSLNDSTGKKVKRTPRSSARCATPTRAKSSRTSPYCGSGPKMGENGAWR